MHRLEHPEMYRKHGLSLSEGLWKKDAGFQGAYEGRT
jgi:hypothetical protein